ncbi:MAG: TdeIII family type II restriction endonuclease [Ignavibacteria bacterium]|nr:TdeIII family type II restriction endonuclease [Ignavibacteria bacterium]
MTLHTEQFEKIKNTIKESIIHKLKNYKPETFNMPFHFRLLGKDRMALFSFIHSLNTTFGTSIFEPVAEILASFKFPFVKTQYVVGEKISENAQIEIQHIINELTTSNCHPNKNSEVERLRKVCNKGNINNLKTVKVDLFIKDNDGRVYLFDIKTAKPNISDFIIYKRTLLEWVAIYLFNEPNADIHSYLAIPYNPYEPKPYKRWTLKGLLDLTNELKVGEEFWDFIGGSGAYKDLLDCFEKAGLELRPEIDKHFSQFI